MTTVNGTTVLPERASDPDAAAIAGCPACAHSKDSHDRIATRFCAATVAGDLARGCACRR